MLIKKFTKNKITSIKYQGNTNIANQNMIC